MSIACALRIGLGMLPVLAGPALAQPGYLLDDAAAPSAAPADRALIYLARLGPPAGFRKADAVYADEEPVALLPKNSYTAVAVAPGLRLVWWSVFGGVDGEWLTLERGQTYLLRGTPAGGAWFLDDPERTQGLIAQRGLRRVRLSEAGMRLLHEARATRYQQLRQRSWQRRRERLAEAGRDDAGTALPVSVRGVSYQERLGRFKEPGYWGNFGELVIDATRVRWHSSDKELDIPVAQIRSLFFAGLSWCEHAAWVGIEYGPARERRQAFFHSPTGFGFVSSYNRKFAALVQARRAGAP